MKQINLKKGDCLELMKKIPDGSVDLVLTDPPYGTMNGIDNNHDWDEIIPTKEMFHEVSRVLRQNGRALLFSQDPYTAHLINNSIVSLPFCYTAIWVKDKFGNPLSCKKAMVGLFENICVFQNKCPNKENSEATRVFTETVKRHGFHKIADIMFQEGRYKDIASARKQLSKKIENNFSEKDYDNFLDEKMIDFLSKKIELGFTSGWYLSKVREYKKKYAPVFNLWQGCKAKPNVLQYPKDRKRLHPTQKPVALLEDLIQTFSNPGDTVLDFTMGSGSTGVACVNTGRNFIGIELDDHYFSVAKERIEKAQKNETD